MVREVVPEREEVLALLALHLRPPPTQPPPPRSTEEDSLSVQLLTSCSTATQYAVSSPNQQKSEKRKRVHSTSSCSGVTIISTMSSTVHTPSPSESSSPYATAASAKDNASRLRENQRRSRARKKEYLTSLEARVQACQRAGVEANVEIQNAAKRVVRENVLLREILRNRGVGDDEIDRIIREGGEGGVNGESAVDGVMKVLGRRPCGGEPLLMEKLGGERFNDRRNSTGMLGARDAGDRVSRGSETPPCPPATGSGTCASAKVRREQRTERRGKKKTFNFFILVLIFSFLPNWLNYILDSESFYSPSLILVFIYFSQYHPPPTSQFLPAEKKQESWANSNALVIVFIPATSIPAITRVAAPDTPPPTAASASARIHPATLPVT